METKGCAPCDVPFVVVYNSSDYLAAASRFSIVPTTSITDENGDIVQEFDPVMRCYELPIDAAVTGKLEIDFGGSQILAIISSGSFEHDTSKLNVNGMIEYANGVPDSKSRPY
mmetsp:Transcript_17011/g.20774  ORF Transcript_17011/g.20774 Transcript_17011/m.20774 type:complete len:113 (-) Transcript_17011:130-468(-)